MNTSRKYEGTRRAQSGTAHCVTLHGCPFEIMQSLLERPEKRVSQGIHCFKQIEIGNGGQNSAEPDICQSLLIWMP